MTSIPVVSRGFSSSSSTSRLIQNTKYKHLPTTSKSGLTIRRAAQLPPKNWSVEKCAWHIRIYFTGYECTFLADNIYQEYRGWKSPYSNILLLLTAVKNLTGLHCPGCLTCTRWNQNNTTIPLELCCRIAFHDESHHRLPAIKKIFSEGYLACPANSKSHQNLAWTGIELLHTT